MWGTKMKSQTGGAVCPNNREYHRLRLEMKHEANRKKIERAVKDGEMDEAEASGRLIMESLRHVNESYEMENRLAKNVLR